MMIMINGIAPYAENEQTASNLRITQTAGRQCRAALPSGDCVGTVDKFHGQEAPVCLMSMTASSADETPRGMEFLFSLNRINVVVSRASWSFGGRIASRFPCREPVTCETCWMLCRTPNPRTSPCDRA
jgi:AAA domain